MTTTDSLAGRLPDGSAARLQIEDGRIAAVEPTTDAPDQIIAPGLVDIQVNGCANIDVNAPEVSAENIVALVRSQWARGVTRFCPTVITGSEDRILRALKAIAAARNADPLVRHAIPCAHVEGPYLSYEDGPRGAHDRSHVRAADIDEFRRWQEASGGVVGIVTLAPEAKGAVDYIKAVSASGVLVSIGHCAASGGEIAAAVDAGARLSTHLGNGCFATLPRHPNPIWEQLAQDRLTASFITDGHHVPAATLTAMIRAKGIDRSVIVSDSTRLTGCEPGEYDEPIGGRVTLHPGGRLTIAGADMLAGSAYSLDECVRWAAQHLEIGLVGAIRLAADNPARLLGIRSGNGFAVGDPADVTVFAPDDLTVRSTVLAGVVVS